MNGIFKFMCRKGKTKGFCLYVTFVFFPDNEKRAIPEGMTLFWRPRTDSFTFPFPVVMGIAE